MADLSTTFTGVRFKNPFLLASAPPTESEQNILRAFEAGWGGVVTKTIGLHPVVSIFALTTGGQLFGLPGMILAVPVAASIQIVLTTLWPQLAEPLPAGERERVQLKGHSPQRSPTDGGTRDTET